MRGGQPVKCFVQIHDQAMQAVAIAVGKPGQSGDVPNVDIIGGSERRRRLDRR